MGFGLGFGLGMGFGLGHRKSVKLADKPDSVHSGYPLRDRHYSGPGVAHPARCYLPANSPRGTTGRSDAANRLTSGRPTWYCCA